MRRGSTAANALDLISQYDLVADGSDNFATRYLVSDACFFAKKPLVTAAVGTFDGTLTTIRAHERGKDGKPNPTYRCLFPEPPPAGTDSGLRGSRHSRRAARRARLDDGAGSDPRDRRLRRRVDRPLADGRCARDAVRDAQLRLGSGQSAVGRKAVRSGICQRTVRESLTASSSSRPWSRPSSPTICLRQRCW